MTGQVLNFPLSLLVFGVFFGLHSVAASSLIGLYDRALISVATPFFRSSCVISSFPTLLKSSHVGLRVSLFMHSLFDIARQRGSAPRSCLCAESKYSFALWSFCDPSDYPWRRPLLFFFNAHDESIADSLLCLLLDFFGDALQHTTTAATRFA